MKPIINVHTHIFTKHHVPQFLGKRILPFTILAYLLPTRFLIWIASQRRYDSFTGRIKRSLSFIYNKVHRYFYYYWPIRLVLSLVYLSFFIILILYWLPVFNLKEWLKIPWLNYDLAELRNFLPTLLFTASVQILLLIVGLLFSKNFRRFLRFILKNLRLLPGKQFNAYVARIIDMGVYSNYDEQSSIFVKLRDQYPLNSKFVVLPMDMEYMEAGPVPVPYINQIKELEDLISEDTYKQQLLPFIFADPRRMRDTKNSDPTKEDSKGPKHLKYIKDKLKNGFIGIKLYPALGYFPFEKELLELYLYACKHDIPIMTHCTQGIIFNRGKKKYEYHPIFPDIHLSSYSNYEFCNHYSHPLNYACLLNPDLLKKVLHHYNDAKIDKLFGYDRNRPDKALTNDLEKLKICLAHFGGSGEWERHLENERNDFEIINLTNQTINMSEINEANFKNKWFDASWYSLIINLMDKYPKIYSDLSYILHEETLFPLIKQTLAIKEVKDRVLFGSDFYVVRQKGSDRRLWVDLFAYLDEEEVDLIARKNPKEYLGL